ncbi:MAG: hypothetical protein QM597_01080 [Aeromicrobium sp.]|uniref:hypothetical protein n=1 Tax=Aeromicrobium sp. TaxID=1871063 RepID=UPI0039E56ED9
MSYPPPPPPGPPPSGPPLHVSPTTRRDRPAGEGVIWFARTLDWLAIIAFAVFWFGLGVLLHDQAKALLGVGIFMAVFGSLLCILVQSWLLPSSQTTVGLMLLGLRALPPIRFRHGLDWFFEYWLDVLMIPVDWLFRRKGDRPTGIVPDPRTRNFPGRFLRFVLVVLIACAPLPLILVLNS